VGPSCRLSADWNSDRPEDRLLDLDHPTWSVDQAKAVVRQGGGRLHVTRMPSPSKRKSSRRKAVAARPKVQAHRDRFSCQGARPIQIWVPDTRSPKFIAEAARQSRRVASSTHAAEDQAFIDAISVERAE